MTDDTGFANAMQRSEAGVFSLFGDGAHVERTYGCTGSGKVMSNSRIE